MLVSPPQSPVVTVLGGVGGQSPSEPGGHCAGKCRWSLAHRALWSLCCKVRTTGKRAQDDLVAWALGCDSKRYCAQSLRTQSLCPQLLPRPPVSVQPRPWAKEQAMPVSVIGLVGPTG